MPLADTGPLVAATVVAVVVTFGVSTTEPELAVVVTAVAFVAESATPAGRVTQVVRSATSAPPAFVSRLLGTSSWTAPDRVVRSVRLMSRARPSRCRAWAAVGLTTLIETLRTALDELPCDLTWMPVPPTAVQRVAFRATVYVPESRLTAGVLTLVEDAGAAATRAGLATWPVTDVPGAALSDAAVAGVAVSAAATTAMTPIVTTAARLRDALERRPRPWWLMRLTPIADTPAPRCRPCFPQSAIGEKYERLSLRRDASEQRDGAGHPCPRGARCFRGSRDPLLSGPSSSRSHGGPRSPAPAHRAIASTSPTNRTASSSLTGRANTVR
ncbi:hypothetical protein DEI82_02365 [Curtobacterium sp. MCBD17_019]|nr:hypothetical protein DEI86_15520 [Curtobacterium sp. MCBD17_028]PZE77681.1 hypothetical protein DEI82_02365 [Curtobacterium sp. MCBD17_019]